ncbi:MAG TPA: carboxypeptidase regulatory-like domain-containing protein [Polyangiaceae bacterium]|nr:carboxypeptidase regulatory-like domain-containing protein [Polyangiaceae bacterium]
MKIHRTGHWGALAIASFVAASASCSQEPPSTTVFVNTGGATSPTTGGAGGASNSSTGGTIVVNTGGSITVGGGNVGGAPGACKNLQCAQTSCKVGACTQKECASGETTVTGMVYDPAGKVPLYNVIVYVPNGPVMPFTAGATCDRCGQTIVNPVVSALTDTAGKFVLKDVPVGQNIPLVMQIGKWRRQITIPSVTACVDTQMMDPQVMRLPRNKAEGDIPLIAITTGGADSMECLPRRMGIDDAEFTPGSGDGRIHLYNGSDHVTGGAMDVATKTFDATLNGGAAMLPATGLWGTTESLSKYDIVILSCEGGTMEMDKPMSARQALYDYSSIGGRVFASHWHRVWFSNGPQPVPTVGTWSDRTEPTNPSMGAINTGFPKGAALAEWLVNVGASTTAGQLEIREPRDNVQAVDPALATSWITVQNSKVNRDPETVQYLSFNTPITAPDDMKCGREVFTDLHVSTTGATGTDTRGVPFPSGCQQRDLSPQEKAVEFMLFDLSSCVMRDDTPPKPPEPPR